MKAYSVFRPRLIPITILAASFLTGVKLVDAWTGTTALLGVAAAEAQAPKTGKTRAATGAPASLLPAANLAKAPAPTENGAQVAALSPAQAAAAAAPAPANSAPANPTPTAPSASPAPAAVPAAGGDAGTPVAGGDKPAAAPADKLTARDPSTYSKSEVEVLQDLAKRRDEIETRSRELDMRENVLAAAAKKIDSRIAELKTLESKIQGLLQQRDEQNEKNLKSLVKVYENMKPQDAARIFEKLDMPILLDVAGRMREAKLAQVLANMNPDKARSITTELATWRQPADSAGKNG